MRRLEGTVSLIGRTLGRPSGLLKSRGGLAPEGAAKHARGTLMVDWWLPVQALWLMLPAYVANMVPVVLAKVFPKWSWPIDGGRARPDGTRLLGDGKTWRGLIGGTLIAGVLAYLMARHLRFSDHLTDFGVSATGSWLTPVWIGLAMGLGALVGDAVKSYFKRKSGRARGKPWIGPDQLDFVVGGLLFAAVAGLLVGSAPGRDTWTYTWFVAMWAVPLFIVIATPLLHWIVNVIGYKLGLKREPW